MALQTTGILDHCYLMYLCICRITPQSNEEIENLQSFSDTPLSHLPRSDIPPVNTRLGPVQKGSPLQYHVSIVCISYTQYNV